MLVRTYECCGTVRSTESERIPLCGFCRGPMTWKQTRDYVRAAHVPKFGEAPALDYNQTKGRVAPIGEHGVEVNSLRDIRRIERESEQRYRDGVGEPYVFRLYSQDSSNRDVGTLGDAPSAKPSQDWLRKQQARTGRPFKDTVTEAEAEAISMGPGAREDLASPLPE